MVDVTPRGIVNVGQLATGFLPGAIPQTANVVLDGVDEVFTTSDEDARLKKFGINAENEKNRSNILKRTLDGWKTRLVTRLGRAGASAAGAVGGGAAATALCLSVLGPPGLLAGFAVGSAGALAGGYMANKACDAVCSAEEHKTALLVTEITEAQQAKEPVPAQVVFLALAGHLNEKQRREVQQAWAKGDSNKLDQLMYTLDNEICIATGMPPSAGTTASERYAELINGGRMDARDLLFQDKLMAAAIPVIQDPYVRTEMDAIPPATPMMPTRNGSTKSIL